MMSWGLSSQTSGPDHILSRSDNKRLDGDNTENTPTVLWWKHGTIRWYVKVVNGG